MKTITEGSEHCVCGVTYVEYTDSRLTGKYTGIKAEIQLDNFIESMHLAPVAEGTLRHLISEAEYQTGLESETNR